MVGHLLSLCGNSWQAVTKLTGELLIYGVQYKKIYLDPNISVFSGYLYAETQILETTFETFKACHIHMISYGVS